MRTVTDIATAETCVKKSRFLAEIFPISSVQEAKEQWLARKKSYDNGGHIVYAFAVGKTQNICNFSDDGEPAGTAGRPVLSVLQGAGITNAMITVARWYGGIKLGRGGLVHAYGNAAKAAADAAVFSEIVTTDSVRFCVPYGKYAHMQAFLKSCGFRTISENFNTAVDVSGEILHENLPLLHNYLLELNNGRETLLVSETSDGIQNSIR